MFKSFSSIILNRKNKTKILNLLKKIKKTDIINTRFKNKGVENK